ncbi:hypothetical protein DIPPA_17580 [Diplonema papillatum]|nr:hypothetical protein DIPPA_17580 [Diplonema papillatum]
MMRAASSCMLMASARRRAVRTARGLLQRSGARRWQTVGEPSGAEGIVHDIESSDPFQILGVTRFSTPAEVQTHYKKLALMYHPDRPSGSEELFNKIVAAKDMVLLRLGDKTEDEVPEKASHHEAEYTYNEETTEWEYKKGRMRMYDDYVDVSVERQRMTIWFVQTAIGVCLAWVLIENLIEAWFTSNVVEDQMSIEGRMFAAGKRKDYEKEAEAHFIAKHMKGSEPNSTYTEAFTVEDPFADHKVRRQVVRWQSWTDRFITFFEWLLPTFGRWLRFVLLPDSVRGSITRMYG